MYAHFIPICQHLIDQAFGNLAGLFACVLVKAGFLVINVHGQFPIIKGSELNPCQYGLPKVSVVKELGYPSV
ncbi:hypothetical protein [Stenotrophomonas phage CM2]